MPTCPWRMKNIASNKSAPFTAEPIPFPSSAVAETLTSRCEDLLHLAVPWRFPSSSLVGRKGRYPAFYVNAAK